jgi:hypothetical protein
MPAGHLTKVSGPCTQQQQQQQHAYGRHIQVLLLLALLGGVAWKLITV